MNALGPVQLPVLMLVTDRRRLLRRRPIIGLEDVVREAVAGGVSVVQLREKDLPTGVLVALGLKVREALDGESMLFVNRNIDAARTLNADGLHIPSFGPTVRDIKSKVGSRLRLSLAVHSKERALVGEREGVDFVVLGTAFKSKSKPDAVTLGISGIAEVTAAMTTPVIAIGGITASNAGDAIRAGASGVAVIGAIMDAPDPRAAARELRTAIDAAWAER